MNDNRRRGIIKFTWDHGSNFATFWDQGSKFGAKKLGSAMKKYTWLRPCRPLPPPPHLFLDQIKARKAEKNFLETAPPPPC